MKLKRNMGEIDRILRAAMGASLIYLGPLSDTLTTDPMSGALLGAFGVLTVAAALLGSCTISPASPLTVRVRPR